LICVILLRQIILYSLSLFGDNLLTVGDDYQIKVWDMKTKEEKPIQKLNGHTDVIRAVQMNEDLILSGECNNIIRIWNSKTYEYVASLSGHTRSVFSLSFREKHTCFSGSLDASLKEWDLSTLTCVRTYQDHAKGIKAVSCNNSFIVSGSYDHSIKIWDRLSGVCISTLNCHTATVNAIAISDNLLVSGSEDRTLAVYDPRKFSEQKHKLRGHQGWVRSVAIRGLHGISGSYDDTIKIWDLSSGQCLHTGHYHKHGVEAVAVDSFRLVSGDILGTSVCWDFREPSGVWENGVSKRKNVWQKPFIL